MKTIDIILNLLIFGITAALLIRFARKDGGWTTEKLKVAFRFFTCQSNVLCAATALLTAAALLAGNDPIPRWVWTLKYIGTAGVTLTMLTVFLYLWPMLGKDGYKKLLGGADFFLHLLTPMLAILSFFLLRGGEAGHDLPAVPVGPAAAGALRAALHLPCDLRAGRKGMGRFLRFQQAGEMAPGACRDVRGHVLHLYAVPGGAEFVIY